MQSKANCKVRLNCSGPCQVLKTSKIKMMRAIIIPRLFCSPDSFCHMYLRHFHYCWMQRNKIVLSLSLSFRCTLETCVYFIVFRIPPLPVATMLIFCSKTLTNIILQFLSGFALFKPGTFFLNFFKMFR